MASPLDMSLDDLIKSSKKSSGSSRGTRGRSHGLSSGSGSGGPSRRLPGNRSANRSAPYSVAKAPNAAWQHDMYATQMDGGGGYPVAGSRAPPIETGVKLHISNLDYGVSNEDIKELFSEVGDLKRYSVNYDRSGRSKGTAAVVFSRKADALAAINKYNNVQLDGKPMKIELLVQDVPQPTAAPPPRALNGNRGNPDGALKSGSGRGPVGLPRNDGGRRRGRDRGRGKGPNEPISAATLDADLDKYHAESMQIN